MSVCGSFGALGVITSATFKLAPLPQASRTLVLAVGRVGDLGSLAISLSEAGLAPTAISSLLAMREEKARPAIVSNGRPIRIASLAIVPAL